MAKALTIAGSDTSSGAGIQQDLRTFSLRGVYGTSVITAVTAQNTRKVLKIVALQPAVVRAQIRAVMNDMSPDAIKVGMVYSWGVVNAVACMLKDARVPIVLDPVFRASTGARLLRDDAYGSFVKRLVPLATVLTPNRTEAEKLAGTKIRNVGDAKTAARRILELGADSVLVKGGHLRGREAVDILYDGEGFVELGGGRIGAGTLHGAGSIFSAVLAAEMAKQRNPADAARTANQITRSAIANAEKIGRGLKIPSLVQKPTRNKLLASLQGAVERLESAINNPGMIIPESQSNIVFAKPNAGSPADVAAVRGRIVKLDGSVKAAGLVAFGASRHVASAVLAMMEHDQTIRSAMNIKYSERIIRICSEELGLRLSSYDRRSEPPHLKEKEGMSVRWGIGQAVSNLGGNNLPDVVYHLGDWGKEPMILVFGREPAEVAARILAILEIYTKR